MTNAYPNRELDLNGSVQEALHVFRRRPWTGWARRTWDAMRLLFLPALLATSVTAVLATPAHAKTYDAVNVDVPFKFNIGRRAFRPGHYQLIIVGNGLLAMRDARQHTVASLVTRSVDAGGPAPVTKLVFQMRKKRAYLDQVRIENHSLALQVVGEQLAIRQPEPSPELPRFVIESMFQRNASPGLKH